MFTSTSKWILLHLVAVSALLHAQAEGYAEPDKIMLKDGAMLRGVVVRNSADAVWMQERYAITKIPKSEIVRIFDEADTGLEFTEADKRSDLPSWRVMVNDLRNNDAIKSLEQIPATHIDNGYLKNVPYLSFRINEFLEMNVYGDPDNPAAVEIGAYGRPSSNDKLPRTLRSFMAGFLSSRKEIAAIYSIPFSGGQKAVGDTSIKITPASAPDAYGGWWISVYLPKSVEGSRLSDAEYARLTRPPNEILGKNGRIKRGAWQADDLQLSARTRKLGDKAAIFVRGFFRDASGEFRPLPGNPN
jgi:hypothetical protein